MVDIKTVMPERGRRLNGLDMELHNSDPMLIQGTISGSPKRHSPIREFMQILKGLGKKRRKSSTASPAPEYNCDISWQVNQVKCLSEEKNSPGDSIVSCLAYEDEGEYVAAGCKNGKIVVLHPSSEENNQTENGSMGVALKSSRPFGVYTSFQSHEAEFDFQKSVVIDEKINKLRWVKRGNPARFLLSTNDRTVKLWKLSERRHELDFHSMDDNKDCNFATSLRVPKYKRLDNSMVVVSQRRTYFEAHNYAVNSLSVNSDMETFITADDLKINLWHMEVPDQSFNIVDVKPENMDDLSEVITTAEFHPEFCSWLVYGNSKGAIRLCDLRSQALCDKHSKSFREKEEEGSRTLFSDIIASISDIKFSNSGRFLLTRDYLNLKVWDLHMESEPVEKYPVNELLRSKLCTLYENDHIFDKFDCSWCCNDRFLATGTYGDCFKVYDRFSGQTISMESSDIMNNKTHTKRKMSVGFKTKHKDEANADNLNFNKKLLHLAWHPKENLLTNAVGNCLQFFQGRSNRFEYNL